MQRACCEQWSCSGPRLHSPQRASKPLLDRREIGAERILGKESVVSKRRDSALEMLRPIAPGRIRQYEIALDLAGPLRCVDEPVLEQRVGDREHRGNTVAIGPAAQVRDA